MFHYFTKTDVQKTCCSVTSPKKHYHTYPSVLFQHLLLGQSTMLRNKQTAVNVQVFLSYILRTHFFFKTTLEQENKKRTPQVPWVSKGWCENQAEQRGSKLRTHLWTEHPSRLRWQGGVCGGTGPHHGPAESHRLNLPLEPASHLKSGYHRTVRADECIKPCSLLQIW